MGRRTLPMLFGETLHAATSPCSCSSSPPSSTPCCTRRYHSGLPVLGCDLALTASCWTVAYRVLHLSGRHADHKTYMGYTYIYCLVLGSGILVF